MTDSKYFFKVVLDTPKQDPPKTKEKPKPKLKQKRKAFGENIASNVIQTLEMAKDLVNMKFLILCNDDEYLAVLKKFVGPIYDDVTLAANETDPLTFDQIWEYNESGAKVACEIPGWQLFSYMCTIENVMKCVTIDTLHDVFDLNLHKSEDLGIFMSDDDKNRASDLTEWYAEVLDYFSTRKLEVSPELAFHNRLVALFSKFKDNTTCFEESWLENISNPKDLKTIVEQNYNIIRNNIALITSDPRGSTLFNAKLPCTTPILTYKIYIVEQWETMISLAAPDNQYPRWIIALTLSKVVPGILKKYPSIKYILG
jgi:hypothetical protein